MGAIPWSHIRSWRCNACGICCRHYDVVLKFPEWLGIVKNYGVKYTAASLNKFFLKRRTDGSCVFLLQAPNASLCSLQPTKPQACKLWPFKILAKPKYGNAKASAYSFHDRELFIYVDPTCPGLAFGPPNYDFAHVVIPEFVDLAFGLRHRQFKSTAILQPFY